MKFKQILAALPLLLALNAGGQTANNVSNQKPSQITVTQVPVTMSQDETIVQLQVENRDLQKQLKELKEEVDLYRGDVRAEISKIESSLNTWMTVFGILIGLFGVIIPWLISKETKKNAEQAKVDAYDAKAQVAEARIQVGNATEQAEQAKALIAGAKAQAEEATKQATQAKEQAKRAKQVLSEIEELKKQVDD